MNVLLDTNVWRLLVDADAVQRLRRTAREHEATIVIAPAVVYEMLRTPDPVLRDQLLKAVTLGVWRRLMTEVYEECQDVLATLKTRRPEWVVKDPDVAYFFKLRADWAGGGFWRRARQEPAAEARRLASLEGDLLDRARKEARERRTDMGTAQFDSVQLAGWTGTMAPGLPGWSGDPVDVWRIMTSQIWWEALIVERRAPYTDWIGPFIDLPSIASSYESWNHLWLHEIDADEAPREWLRWAVMLLQSVRKVTPGTPVDNQLALYTYEADLFLSADRALVDIVNRVRADAPAPVAVAHALRPRTDPSEDIRCILSPDDTSS